MSSTSISAPRSSDNNQTQLSSSRPAFLDGSHTVGHRRSDSGQSLDLDRRREHKPTHHRSKSSAQDRELTEITFKFSNNPHPDSLQGHLKGSYQHARPTSLFQLKTPEGFYVGSQILYPEREPVRFDITLTGAPLEVEQLVNNIKQVAEKFLYHWKTFPICLPNPVSETDSILTSQISSEGSLSRTRLKFHLRDLFIAPSFDELDAVATDGSGEPKKLSGKQLEHIREKGLHKDKYGKPKRLNPKQLESIRLYGEFEVESVNFPGQQHRWKLSELLQKGIIKTKESLLEDLALALRFIFITSKRRIVSPFFSVSQSVKALLNGILKILDMMLGMPSLQAHNLDMKIREERSKYLVAELVCRAEFEETLELLCSYVRKQMQRAATEKFEVTRESCQPPVSVPYCYLTPSGCELDLRLWDRGLMRKALPILVNILERETRGWFLHFRERLVSELKAQNIPNDELEKEVNNAVMKEYLQRVYTSIQSNNDLQELGKGVPQLLIQQAQSVVAMHRALENVHNHMLKSQETGKAHFHKTHPILSRIAPWLRSKLRAAEERFMLENQWSAHKAAIALCQSDRLNQTIYFLNRDLTFMKEREPALRRELRKVKIPTRNFLWPTQIWLPKNWVVRRSFQGKSEVVPTVLCKQATSITTPRSDPSQPVFLVEKEIVRTTTTRWPLWRIFNYCHRTWCWTWNAIFFFGVVLPWCSPVGIRALVYIDPFMPDLELSQVNGTLFPRRSSLTQTLYSRLILLWRHISKSRTHFETKPDTGFIGKGFTRHINRCWNYIIKGVFGTTLLVLMYPIICVTVIISSIVIAFTAIVWVPLLTLVIQFTNGLIYDLDSPKQKRNRFFVFFEAIIWNILCQGVLQPLIALIVASILCPLVAVLVAIGAVGRYWCRLLWDAIVFHSLIKKRGRVPASDSFIVKRISGPGLASEYYFQISSEQALAALEAKMELEELAAYQTVMENIILQPQKDFSNFVESCFGSFSTQLSKTGQYKVLEKEAQDLLTVLHEKLEKRRRELQTGLSVTVKSKIKLSTKELKVALQQGALMLERFYPAHIYPKLGCSEEQFWDNRVLTVGDWASLAGVLYSELFSLDVLTPLDDTDTSFKLDPHPQADLSRYTDMIQSAQLGGGGPDLLGNVYTPRGNIHVQSPYLDVSAFNPRSKLSATSKNNDAKMESATALNSSNNTSNVNFHLPWKETSHSYSADKLVIPLLVPHPSHIALTIYNRDSDDPIPLENEICQSILRGIEETNGSLDETGINRYRGGGEIYETASSGSNITDNHKLASDDSCQASTDGVHQWSLSNWGQRKRNNSGSIRVDLASPEDVTLDSDSTKVVFSCYGTTV